MEQWDGFKGDKWKKIIDVENFIINNYKEYIGSSEFLTGPSKRTNRVWNRCKKILEKEDVSDVLDIETKVFSGIDSFDSGYIDKKSEVIVGLQTDEPLKRFINPYIALDSSVTAAKNCGYRVDHNLVESFESFCVSHEQMVEETYTKDIKKFKEVHLLEGLPDNYGRGFIVSDYRRLPLYGADYLIIKKKIDLERLKNDINYSVVRTREEVVKQINSLYLLKQMAMDYGYDISKPASNAKEAIQWLYFAYLAGIKESEGASIPIGNNSTFLDIYINRDLELGLITEHEAQELIDQFIIKLRMVRFLHLPNYYNYFTLKGPIITETIGGSYDNKSFITKTAYRMLNSLNNIEINPTPNFSILWNNDLPNNFKRYCTKLVLKHNALQFINGDLVNDSSYASTGLSSLSKIGKQIDYYGGICNLPKALLYAINGGRDEITGEKVIDGIKPINDSLLDYSTVIKNFSLVLRKLITTQIDASNIIHYVHDKYSYESSLMSFNDTVVERYITFGICGLSTVVDSLSAIKHSKVKVHRDEAGLSVEFVSSSKFPRFGKNDVAADKLASDIISLFNKIVNSYRFYRNARPKIGIESFGLNIVYGLNTGATPDGRFKGIAYSTGVNPTSNVDVNGILPVLKSVLKIPNNLYLNGASLTLNVNDSTLGVKKSEKTENLTRLLDVFFKQKGRQLEFNIIDKNYLLEANNDKDIYSTLNLRNGGYLVRYQDLTEEQQENLCERTFHKRLS